MVCPRCELHEFTPYGQEFKPGDPYPPALSRLSREENDVPLWICSECGQDEAMLEFLGPGAQPPSEWPVEITYSFQKVLDDES